MFLKSAEPVAAITQEQVLAEVKAAGEQVLGIVTDVPDECHVLTKRADGKRVRHYFDHMPIAKAAGTFAEECARVAALRRQPPPNINDISPETREKMAARYGGQTQETEAMKQAEKDAIAKAAVAEAEAEEFSEQAATTFEKHVNEIKKRDECSAREAMEQAAREFPKEYEEWQTGQPIPA